MRVKVPAKIGTKTEHRLQSSSDTSSSRNEVAEANNRQIDSNNVGLLPEFQILLDDIRAIRPSFMPIYWNMFSKLSKGHYYSDYVYKPYNLEYYERGCVVGGIKATSLDEFRFEFLCHEFFPIRISTAKSDIECMLQEIYPLFERKEIINQQIIKLQKAHNLGAFCFESMTFSDV